MNFEGEDRDRMKGRKSEVDRQKTKQRGQHQERGQTRRGRVEWEIGERE